MTCIYCSEPIYEDDPRESIANGELHRECAIRALLGSAEHIRMECPCYRPGACAIEEPDGLTRREAARRALDALDSRIVHTRAASMN